MENKIKALTNKETFWEDVRRIVGYYDGVHHEDRTIKKLQRIAENRFNEITQCAP